MTGTRRLRLVALNRENGRGRAESRVTTRARDLGLRERVGQLEVEVATGLGDLEGTEDLDLAGRGARALGHPSLGRLHDHEVHAVELVANVAPGVAGRVLDDPHEEEPQPAELDVASDPVLSMMEDGPEPERSLHVPPASLHLE